MAEPLTSITTLVATLIPLVKEYGPKVGRIINEKLHKDENHVKQFLKNINNGLGVTEILKKIFGHKLESIISDAQKAKKVEYETKFTDYISLPIDGELSKAIRNDLLKAELAENLERLSDTESDEKINQARMIVNQWIRRFIEIRYPDGNIDQQTLSKIESLGDVLKPGKINARAIYKHLKPFFGVGSVLSLIYAGMLATATGLGIWASITTFLGGIPIAQVGSVVILSVLLAYLALIPINNETKIQIVINGLYGIIDGEIEDYIDKIRNDYSKAEDEILLEKLEQKLSINVTSTENITLIITLLKHMILIDGDEHDLEMSCLNTYLSGQFSLDKNEIKTFYDLAPSIEDIESFIANLKGYITLEERDILMKILKDLSIADKRIDNKEVILLKKIEALFKN